MDHIIEVSGLKKSYGEIQAVKGISFFVERGKLFAFLGPNGAGKSTTIDMICTFLQPDEGTVTVDGFLLGRDDEAIRANIGAVFQDGLLDALLTVRENLRIRGSFYGLRGAVLDAAVRKAADATGISELLNRQAASDAAVILPGPWFILQRFFSWMNLQPAWIRRPAGAYGKQSPDCSGRPI